MRMNHRWPISKFSLVVSWAFCLLFWLPLALQWLNPEVYPYITSAWLTHYWIPQVDLVFLGHRYPAPHFQHEADSLLEYQEVIAALVLSIIIAIIVLLFDKKYNFIDKYRFTAYKLIYALTAKILSLSMMFFAFFKVFPSQFEYAFHPDEIMASVGSLRPDQLFWFVNGISPPYEVILGLIELVGLICLWIPRLTILGAVISGLAYIYIILMDHFSNASIRILPTIMLVGCLFLLSAELKYFFHYFILHKTAERVIPIISWGKTRKSKIIISTVSIVFLTLSGSLYGFLCYVIYQSHRASQADPMYGVWDSAQYNISLGNHRLETIGIYPEEDEARLSLFTFDRAKMPDSFYGQHQPNRITFSLSDEHGKNVLVILTLISRDEITLQYAVDGKSHLEKYHKRKILVNDVKPSLVWYDLGDGVGGQDGKIA